jgi:hypothetical protein
MKMKLFAATVLVAGIAASVHAQTVTPGDLVLGFSASSGTGSATNLEVDVGAYSSYVSATGTTTVISGLGTDLTSTYGAWNTDTALSWGIAGGTHGVGTNNSLSVTGTYNNGQAGTLYTNVTGSLYSSATSKLVSIYGASLGGLGTGDTTGATVLTDITSQTNGITGAAVYNAITTGTVQASSWTNQSGPSAFGGIGSAGVSASTFLVSESGTGGTTDLDLYHLVSGTGSAVDLGYFALSSSGNLTFTSFTAIPEPSTYAAILGVITAGFVMIRRRKNVLA